MTKSQKRILITTITIALLATICYLLLSKSPAREVLTAENSGIGVESKLSLYSDSTYRITVKYNMLYDNIKSETDTISGKYYLKNDTLHFPEGIKKSIVNKATIKNNLVEFIGTSNWFFSIIKTELDLKPAIDPKKYPDFTIYTYCPPHGNYFEEGSKPYDLEEKDIILLKKILKKQSKEERASLCNNYKKICIAAINPQGQKEIFLECECENETSEDYPPCHVAIRINLTTGRCEDVFCLGG